MFLYNYKFNSNLNSWDTSKVTSMRETFVRNYEFNQPLNKWNTSKVTSMKKMFNLCTIFDQDLSDWDTSNVEEMSHMFNGATNFNCSGGNMGRWDVSKVLWYHNMFESATSFNIDISNWNIRSGAYFHSTFKSATSFNRDLSNWKNLAQTTSFQQMFDGATSFSQHMCWTYDETAVVTYMVRNTNSAIICNCPNNAVYHGDGSLCGYVCDEGYGEILGVNGTLSCELGYEFITNEKGEQFQCGPTSDREELYFYKCYRM